jgi:hypothetical protein
VALSSAAQAADETAYLRTLRELVARLQDGHGFVHGAAAGTPSLLPLALDWAGEELVIVGRQASVPAAVEIGDVIVSIDGRTSADCYAEVSKWISAATEGWRRHVARGMLVKDLPTRDPARVVVRKPDGRTATADLGRASARTAASTRARPESGTELAPGIVYFDINGAEAERLQAALPALAAAQAVIFDLRGYPGAAGVDLMQHLIDGAATSARWCVPNISRPDREGIEWEETGRWQLEPAEPHIGGELAFLTGSGAISYAESIMGIVEHYELGEIIGSTTAGTNGNINPFALPGGYTVSWTGMKVLKHDGSQHHGRGIAPTIPVAVTAAGLAAGRDEVLERAIEVMQAKLSAAGAHAHPPGK